MSGAILINPIFGRRNVPNIVKAGLTLIISQIFMLTLVSDSAKVTTILDFFIKAISEFTIGFVISLIMNIFLSSVNVACDLIDMQIGIGMAKAYDPANGTSSPVTGTVYSSFVILLFFVTNGHITLYKLIYDSFTAIPCGSSVGITGAAYAVAGLMGNSLNLALKFALPITAVEFFSEMGLGVLSRAVPNINVFSVGIQLKVLIGFLVLGILAPTFGTFCDTLFSNMFDGITAALNFITITK
jgi:flagellar biosynthetic protein FliR